MKNINDFEEKFKKRSNTLLILDYNGKVSSTEPKMNSPLSNTRFKRVMENFARKDSLKVAIITNKEINKFKKEYGFDVNEINIYGLSKGELKNEEGSTFESEEKIIADIVASNPDYEVIYVGDDKILISKTKQLGGSAIGILPLCAKGKKNVDFTVSQNKFEETLITINNLYI